jgi:hypothetical protein
MVEEVVLLCRKLVCAGRRMDLCARDLRWEDAPEVVARRDEGVMG